MHNDIFFTQTYQDFILQNSLLRQYDTSRTALGVNPGKLAMLYNGDELVASVVFIDHLYDDGRDIFIPAFDKKISSSDALEARMETHKFIEIEAAKRLGLENLRSGYTDVYPQCPMYWDSASMAITESTPAPITVPVATKAETTEIQLSFF